MLKNSLCCCFIHYSKASTENSDVRYPLYLSPKGNSVFSQKSSKKRY
ncbi:hypothetical protein LEP1GSC050_1749 [Leptospira broomii serovar Hurstbridge str. 5399]|uniref:Uncharacterized protein n=1 Tax=Leptospira broomii serovar Hurstbridge str. 5399 TaxID=1049789 RepID=T0F5L3_9LEPT|nr:hypothetical protein LEP1GSC050_1749 [Leptospira broomii serovar Hurstbridge str. 5399]